VLVFSGSDGGLEYAALTARWLAGLGFPALGISYFGGEGQPDELEDVPVETFEMGLAWLREQPEVDVARVTPFGVSRGGEMALWLAAEYPDLVAGAIAPVGAGAIVCGYPQGVAWTRGGTPLVDPCAMTVVGSPTTQIDVAAINGPVVLACGTDDELWDSCAALDDIAGRRGADSETLATRGDHALHDVAWAPYLPLWFGNEAEPEQVAATRSVQREFWSHVVSILDD
jgi:dienelactone hydrolase